MLQIDHRIYVSGTGSYVAPEAYDNERLAPLVGGYDESQGPFPVWVDRVTHINERRILGQDGSSGDLAREASRIAIEDSGVDPAEIGLFIMATFTTKNLYPGEQTKLTKELGMEGAATFYLTAGCAGAVYGIHIANAMLRCGFIKHALIVGAEHMNSVVDFADPITAILFGDGAGAIVLSRREEEGLGGVVQNFVLGSNYIPGNIMMENNNVPPQSLILKDDGPDGPRQLIVRQLLKMEGGPRVLRTAVNAMADATVKSLGFTMDDLKEGNEELRALLDKIKLIPHQANGRIVDGLRDKLEIPDERVYKTVYKYGNISCASNLITLDYAVRRGNMHRVMEGERCIGIREDVAPRLERGDLVAVPTVGAGYLTGCFTYVHEGK